MCLLVGSATAQSQPNIILIVSDDQGWTDYGFMGHPYILTPNLDKFAAQSLVFTRGYSVTSVCCPSLASILTGQYPHQTQICNNDPPKGGKLPKELASDPTYAKDRQRMIAKMEKLPTLPRLLAEKGYISLQTGKWWQGNFATGGFTAGMSHGDSAKGARHGDAGLDIGRKTMQPMYDFMDAAAKEKKPFFVWYAPMLPHQPHNPPEKYLAHYKDKTASEFERKYAGNVEWFDDTCGQLLDYLEKTKLAENTIVVYLTDNGWIQDPAANKFLRSKLSQYDAGHRTPIMVRWPGKVKAAKSEALASSLDIAPTLLAAAGVKPDAAMAGLNLLDEAAVKARPAIFGEDYTHDAVDIDKPASSLRFRWIIDGEWKLIVSNRAVEPKAEIELYHITADPAEKTNLAATEKDRAAALAKKLDVWWKP
jgi:uncharacterized sulfatase